MVQQTKHPKPTNPNSITISLQMPKSNLIPKEDSTLLYFLWFY